MCVSIETLGGLIVQNLKKMFSWNLDLTQFEIEKEHVRLYNGVWNLINKFVYSFNLKINEQLDFLDKFTSSFR